VRSHGWSGNTPSSDEEAVNRILDSAERMLAKRGSALRISDVARDLGITRQTVYRYFPGTDVLTLATAMRSANGFLDQLTKHLRGETDPVKAVVEGMAYAIEKLGDDRKVRLVLSQHQTAKSGVTMAEAALTFSRSMLHALDVDWRQYGYSETELDELADFSLRILNSFLAYDRGRTALRGAALRSYLTRWIGPAIAYPRLAAAMEALSPGETVSPRRRNRAV